MFLADSVARDATRTYGAEWDDARSVAILAAYNRQTYAQRAFAEGRDLTIRSLMWKAVVAFVEGERRQAMVQSGQWFYDVEYVRLFLPYAFDHEDWINGPVADDPLEKWVTGSAMETALDIRLAWENLRDWQARIILARHVTVRPSIGDGGPDWEAIANETGYSSADAARKAYERATLKLCDFMNSSRVKRAERKVKK